MIKHVLSAIGGVGVYGAISIVLFFVVFMGALLYSVTMRASVAGRMSRLPLADDDREDAVKGEVSHD